jgi:hypothetical protein
VKEDRAKSFALLVKSAQQDYRLAQALLFSTYSRGDAKAGVAQDKIEAYKWFLIGVGVIEIPEPYVDRTKHITETMTPAEISDAKKLAEDWMAKNRKKR